MSRNLVVISAGVSAPSSTRLLADQLAEATVTGVAEATALAGECRTSSGPNTFVFAANSIMIPFGSVK